MAPQHHRPSCIHNGDLDLAIRAQPPEMVLGLVAGKAEHEAPIASTNIQVIIADMDATGNALGSAC